LTLTLTATPPRPQNKEHSPGSIDNPGNNFSYSDFFKKS